MSLYVYIVRIILKNTKCLREQLADMEDISHVFVRLRSCIMDKYWLERSSKFSSFTFYVLIRRSIEFRQHFRSA